MGLLEIEKVNAGIVHGFCRCGSCRCRSCRGRSQTCPYKIRPPLYDVKKRGNLTLQLLNMDMDPGRWNDPTDRAHLRPVAQAQDPSSPSPKRGTPVGNQDTLNHGAPPGMAIISTPSPAWNTSASTVTPSANSRTRNTALSFSSVASKASTAPARSSTTARPAWIRHMKKLSSQNPLSRPICLFPLFGGNKQFAFPAFTCFVTFLFSNLCSLFSRIRGILPPRSKLERTHQGNCFDIVPAGETSNDGPAN